jgi:two-component system sensor histidine kinase PhoQ
MWSLNTRLLLAGGMVLACFLGITGITLDRVFRDSARDGVNQRLQAHIYALIAAADIADDGVIRMPRTLPEGRFTIPLSGLYAQIDSNVGGHDWRSPSMVDMKIPFASGLKSAVRHFQRLTTSDGKPVFAVSFGVTWDQSNDPAKGYTFSVAESLDGYNAQVGDFRRNLWGWLGGAAVVLLAAQSIILRWGLAPLRRAAQDLERIESGQRRELAGPYPKELRTLTDNLNALLTSQREHLERYRHTLDDLAHSLKTPLAILRGSLQRGRSEEGLRLSVGQQVERMSQIVHYQLQRAATSGRTVLTAPVAVRDTVDKVIASLNKVYGGKSVDVELAVAPDAVFHGDEGDLMEIIGNLADNAYKWCRTRVRVSAAMEHGAEPRLVLCMDDDGPGISPSLTAAVLQRGVRGDVTTEGQGIGLAIVQDILRVYRGDLHIDTGPLGGARVTVGFPR